MGEGKDWRGDIANFFNCFHTKAKQSKKGYYIEVINIRPCNIIFFFLLLSKFISPKIFSQKKKKFTKDKKKILKNITNIIT